MQTNSEIDIGTVELVSYIRKNRPPLQTQKAAARVALLEAFSLP